jgi:uncharacterized protein YjdB
MKKLNFKILSCLLAGIFLCWHTVTAQLATGKTKFLGNVLGNNIPANFATYWNQVTPENASKWGSVESSRDQMNWTTLDNYYNYAKTRGFKFKFHTLIWGSQYPSWLTSLSAAEQKEEIIEWIAAVANRYPDVDMIDVVNEPTKTPLPFKNAIGGDGTTGWDWVIWAFETARQYFPNAKLLINEYGTENDPSAADKYLQIINLLKTRGLIDGIGLQGHYFNLDYTSASTLKSTLDKFAATGLPIYISELDIRGISGNNSEQNQMLKYQEIFPVMWEHPAVQGITLWGYIEGQTWVDGTGIVRSDGTEKAAMVWLKQYMGSSTTVPVTGVTVSPTTLSLTVGQTATLTATVSPANATNKNVTWSSSNSSVATVSSTGVVTAVAAGSATITVTTVDGAKTATCAVTVTGSTTVPVTGVTVSPTTLSLTVGQTATLTATVSPANATNKNVTWSSSNTSVATVSSMGVVTAVAAGSATITVTTVDGAKTATCAVTVTAGGTTTPCSNPVTKTLPLVQDGAGEFCWVVSGTINYVNSWNMQSVQINGVDYTNKWSNSMPATINGNYYIYYKANVAWAHLEVDGTSGGSTTVPVTGVTVSPTTLSLTVGQTATLTATVSPANATNKNVTWSSSNTSVATVSSTGVVTAVAAGSATITVTTVDGAKTATCAVTVTGSTTVPVTGVTVSPTTLSLTVGQTATLTATVSPANATNKNVTWSSSNTSVATVSSTGVVTAVAAGSATITVTTVDGAKTATCAVTVTAGGTTTPCNNPIAITIPFSKDGAGEFCYVSSQQPAYVNSWNMDKVEINGVDYTNKWSNTMPAAIGGKWYIYYKGSFPWSHFEAPAAKSIRSTNSVADFSIYPNPFTNEFFLYLKSVDEIDKIEIFNPMGQLVLSLNKKQIHQNPMQIRLDAAGNYFIIKVSSAQSIRIERLVRQ